MNARKCYECILKIAVAFSVVSVCLTGCNSSHYDNTIAVSEKMESYRNLSYGDFLKQGGQEAEFYHAGLFTAAMENGLELVFLGSYEEENAGYVLRDEDTSIRVQGSLGKMVSDLTKEMTADDFVNELTKVYGQTTEYHYLEGAGTAYYVGDNYVQILLDIDGDSNADTELDISLDDSEKITSDSLAWLSWIA